MSAVTTPKDSLGNEGEGNEQYWAVKLKIKGKVQGVFYRATAATSGERIGVVGYVCNLSDGSVELLAQGTRKQVEEMKAWCHIGPPMAVVTAVEEVFPMMEIGALEYQRFQLRRDREPELSG